MDKKTTISRRDFLRGASALSAAGILAACAPATPAATEAPEPEEPAEEKPTEAPPEVEMSKGPVNVIYGTDANDFFANIIDDFEAETGVEVAYEVSPAGYIEWQEWMSTRLASADPTVDTFHCDDFQAAMYGAAEWLLPLDPLIDKFDIDLDDWPPTLINDVSSWKGKLYRLPWGNDTEIFFYRTDFFEEAGVEPPKTWDDIVTIGAELTQGDERYAIGLSGSKGGQLGNDIHHWCNQAGAAINNLDNDGGRQALTFYKDLFATYKIAQPSTPQDDYTAVFNGWLDNRYAMWWCWDGFFGAMRTNEDFWADQVSAFLPPMGPDNATTVTGTWGWAISAYSAQTDLAEMWFEYTARPEVMKQQMHRGRVPARISLWGDPEVQDLAPSAPFLEMLAAAGNLVKARPVTPSIQEIYDAAEEPVSAFLTDQMTVDEAVKAAMDKINPILERDLAG